MSLANKLDAWCKSPVGKKRMEDKLQEYRKNGVKTTAAGSSVMGEDRAERAAAKFMELLNRNALSCNLPASVMTHIQDMHAGKIIETSEGFELPIYFGGDLHRDSLENDVTEYDGIDNIVALFNNGYHASDYVYGWWDGHAPSGEAFGRAMSGSEDFAWVRSKKDREALRFIQQTIADFNGNYAADFDITAVAAEVYE